MTKTAADLSEEDELPVVKPKATPAKAPAPVAKSKPAKVDLDDDDDALSYFQSIADSDE